MSRPASPSAALPIAHAVLRTLIVLNWLMAAVILALLVVVPNEQWIMTTFKLTPSPDATRLVMGLRAIAVLSLAAIPVNYIATATRRVVFTTMPAGLAVIGSPDMTSSILR